jgi:hypothetical protein
MAVCVWSPGLDGNGNSLAGVTDAEYFLRQESTRDRRSDSSHSHDRFRSTADARAAELAAKLSAQAEGRR